MHAKHWLRSIRLLIFLVFLFVAIYSCCYNYHATMLWWRNKVVYIVTIRPTYLLGVCFAFLYCIYSLYLFLYRYHVMVNKVLYITFHSILCQCNIYVFVLLFGVTKCWCWWWLITLHRCYVIFRLLSSCERPSGSVVQVSVLEFNWL